MMNVRSGKWRLGVVVERLLLLWLIAGFAAPTQSQTLEEMQAATIQKYEDVIANGSAPQNLQALHAQLSDRNSAVRIMAAQSLALVGGPMGALLLTKAMSDNLERDAAVRMAAAEGLGDVGGRQALEVLGLGLDDRDPAVRKRVVQSLRWAGTVFAVPYIQEAIRRDRDVTIRLEAVRMLRKIGTQFSVEPLVEAVMTDRDLGVRLAAADALGEVGKKERQVARYLGEAYRQERDIGVRLELVGSMGLVRDRAGLPYLREAMLDRDLTVKLRATEVYGRVLGLQ
jgi:HEAT repeat protein